MSLTSQFQYDIIVSCKSMFIRKNAAECLEKTLPAAFFMHKYTVRKEGSPMLKKLALKERLPRYYWSLMSAGTAFLLSMQLVFAAPAANTIWTKFSEVMKDIYTQLLGISTIVAVVAAAVALIVRMVSRNQRAVDEASSWLKRIVITWVILNTLGFIIAYIQPWIQGGQYTP